MVAALILCATGFSQPVDLDRGKYEIRGYGGVAGSTALFSSSPNFSAGVEASAGLNRYLAATGNYTFNDIGQTGFCLFGSCAPIPDQKVHEFMAGLRGSLPNHSRVTPYACGTIGAVRLVNFDPSLSPARFAFGVGGGLDIRIGRATGFVLDLRGIDPRLSGTWIVRSTIGYYFRF